MFHDCVTPCYEMLFSRCFLQCFRTKTDDDEFPVIHTTRVIVIEELKLVISDSNIQSIY